ncbi:MAG: phosphoserine transaminase [Actinobacteria bacterium]|nr:MAG: phosphoserine transaminase [Actinomycetota bacterium]
MDPSLSIPTHILPVDGRFGCGPAKVRNEQVAALTPLVMGTSHRQRPVRSLVASIRSGLKELYHLPDDWEVVLGNGGSTAFWAVAATSLIRRRSAHAVFGEFGQKFANETLAAPHLAPSVIVSRPPGSVALLSGDEDAEGSGPPVDVYAYPHHETSTGALSPLYSVGNDETLTLVDATSIAGGIVADVTLVDAYYFAPQKCFGSDGGLWIALMSPRAQERAHELHAASDRWMPQILDLSIALKNARADQTLNTPAIATLTMLEKQVAWMLDNGGLPNMEARARASSDMIYAWAEHSPYAHPFIDDPQWRSPVVVTVDFDDAINAANIASILRAHGVVDVEPYRKLGRNQLRIASFPAIEQSDIRRLCESIDWILSQRSR